jgi:hypothetical protein
MDRSQTKGLRGRHGNKGKVALQPEVIGGTKVLHSPQGLNGADVILRIRTRAVSRSRSKDCPHR